MSRADRVGIAAESTMGTAETTASYGVPLEGQAANLNRDILDINEMLGGRGPSTSEYGVRFGEGTWNGAVRPASFPLLLANYMGAPTTAVALAATAWTHTFDPLDMGASDYPTPLTIWGINKDRLLDDSQTPIADPIIVKQVGTVGNQITISAEVNNYVRAEGTNACLSMDVDDTTEPSLTSDTSRKWVFNQVKVEMDVAPIAAYAETYAQSFSYVYGNNLITDLGRLGSLNLWDLPLGPEITSTLTVNFLSGIPSHFRRQFEDSPTQVALKLTAEGATISGAHKFTFSLEFPYLETVGAPIERSGGDTLRSVEVTFNNVTDPTSGKLVTPVIKNATDGTLYVP